MPQGRRHLLVLSGPVVKPRLPVPLAIPSCATILAAVVMPLCLIAQHVVLCMDKFVLFRLDGYADMLVARITGILNRLRFSFLPTGQPDCENRTIAFNRSTSALQELSRSVV